jgi:lon-related putative ATP-dependent protease
MLHLNVLAAGLNKGEIYQEGIKMSKVLPLDASELYRRTDPEIFDFQTTEDLEDLDEVIGQPRAVDALRFGIGIRREGYNIFALGPSGTGKRAMVRKSFEEQAASESTPDDWIYVNNFEQRNRPRAISLPAGKGQEFKRDMENLVEELRTSLSAAFESDEYRTRKQVIEQEFQEQQEKSLEGIQERARENNLSLIRTPGGLVFAPMREGEVLSPEEFQGMSDEDRKQIESKLEEFQGELQKLMQSVPDLQRRIRDRMRELNREVINFAVGGLMQEIQSKYSEFEPIREYLSEARENILENATDFLQEEEDQGGNGNQNPMAALMARARAGQPSPLRRFDVNLLVDNSQLSGAPVIEEDNPTYQNLIGEVEHTAQMGALLTDFTLIKPGALHRANGGYLILDVRKVLVSPYAWEALKRALQSSCLRIESIGQMLSLISTASLEPEPIPLNVKIGLYGDRMLYYLLSMHDPEFSELFKVQADFEEIVTREEGTQERYARLIGTIVRQHNLKPFDRSAVARVIEHSARMTGDSERLSMQVREISDILDEADYWAGVNGRETSNENGVVSAEDVQMALDKRIYRADRLRERDQETILRGTIFIDTQGEKVGQINGLSVLQLAGFSFGRPTRITARVRMGKGELVNIEREVEMSGPIHSKGVLILGGFLGARYAYERPLSLNATLVFEQSYAGVEGDSASSTELYALLSAIANVPLKQSLAVTGSVNQHGQVQPIGGVNEKIEGFFEICKSRGLTGDQGVLIPRSNVKHLMLRHDVIQAVKEGQFHIYPVETIDQGIELLTGMPAGEADEEGKFPEDTLNGRVQSALLDMAEKSRQLQAKNNGKDDEK